MIEFIGFLFIITVGTLAHFTYELSNHNKIVGLFTAVNESTWEHIKLALGPSFLWIIIEIFFIDNKQNFFFAKFTSLAIIIISIPILFYLYQAIFKKSNAIFNIFNFIFSIGLGQLFSYFILNNEYVNNIVNIISVILLIKILLMYLLLTYFSPNYFLFIDPITNKSGFMGHSHKK